MDKNINNYDSPLALWAWPIDSFEGYSPRRCLYGLGFSPLAGYPYLLRRLRTKLAMTRRLKCPDLHIAHKIEHSDCCIVLSYSSTNCRLGILYHSDNYDHEFSLQATSALYRSNRNLLSDLMSVCKTVFAQLHHRSTTIATQHSCFVSKYFEGQAEEPLISQMFDQLNYGGV